MSTIAPRVIRVHNELGAPIDTPMLQACLDRISHHLRGGNVESVDLFLDHRVPPSAPAWRHPGWIEWHILFNYTTGSRLLLAAIQRQEGEPYEFHS